MPNTYYIDGYNVIHHSSVLQPLAAQHFEAAREALIEKVGRFCVATGNRVKIVFDGRGRRAEPQPAQPNVPQLEVVYSAGHQSADTLIERIVYMAEQRRSIIVVSADRGIRSLCRGMHALVMDPDNFLSLIHEADTETRATLELTRRPDNLLTVENRLGGEGLLRLRELKKRLDR